MAKQVFRILDNLSPSQVKLATLSRPIDGLNNMFINELGQVEKRKGYVKYNTTSIGASHKIVGLHRFYKQDTSSKEMLAAWNTGIYKLAEASPHGATLLTNCPTLTADKDTYFADFYNNCYIVNSVDSVMKYNMVKVRLVGMTVPAAPTFASNIDGDLTAGTYCYQVTYVDEDGYESNGSGSSAGMAALASPNDGIVITIPVSDDPKVTKRRIYRTAVDGAIFYYEGEVANNTATTFSSTLSDAIIILNTVLHDDHDAPVAAAQLITKRENRLYLANGDDLCISALSDVDYFPPSQFIVVGNRQKITGMIEQLSALPIFTNNSIERLIGVDEDNFEFRNAYSDKGCIAPRSLVICDNLLIYLSYDGVYYFDGVNSGTFNPRLNKYIKDNINRTYIHLSSATYFNDRYLLSYPKGASTVPSETIWIDWKTKTMGVYSYAFSCYCKWDKGGDSLRLFGGSSTEGRVYEIDSGTTDDAAAIACYDKTDPIDLGIPERWKQFYNIYIKVKSTTGTALTFYYTLDNNAETSKSLTLTPNTTKWYKIDLEGGGQRARAITLRPCVSDAYDITFMGYILVFEIESEEYK